MTLLFPPDSNVIASRSPFNVPWITFHHEPDRLPVSAPSHASLPLARGINLESENVPNLCLAFYFVHLLRSNHPPPFLLETSFGGDDGAEDLQSSDIVHVIFFCLVPAVFLWESRRSLGTGSPILVPSCPSRSVQVGYI